MFRRVASQDTVRSHGVAASTDLPVVSTPPRARRCDIGTLMQDGEGAVVRLGSGMWGRAEAAPAHMSKTKAELERDVAIAMQSLRDYEDRLQSKGGAASAVSDAAALGAVLVAVLAVVFASWALLRRP